MKEGTESARLYGEALAEEEAGHFTQAAKLYEASDDAREREAERTVPPQLPTTP